MPDAFISGNSSYFRLGAVSYSFNGWRLNVDPGLKKFFAFGSAFQRTLPGGFAASISADGPYNAGNMPLTPGVVYEAHLGFDTGIEFVVSARLGPVDYTNKIQAGGDPATISVTLESEGAFSINFT